MHFLLMSSGLVAYTFPLGAVGAISLLCVIADGPRTIRRKIADSTHHWQSGGLPGVDPSGVSGAITSCIRVLHPFEGPERSWAHRF